MNFRINFVAALVASAIMTMTSVRPCAAQVNPYYDEGPRYCHLLEMYMAIPDHDCVSEDAKALMTDDLYAALQTAWHVPERADYLNEIGGDEFLLYFVSGNGDYLPSHTTIDFSNPAKASDGYWYVTMTITQRPDGEQHLMTHKFKIVQTDKGFLLDDFDDAKSHCLSYISSKSKEFKDIASGMTVGQYLDRYFSKDEISFYESDALIPLRSNIQRYLDDVRTFVRSY